MSVTVRLPETLEALLAIAPPVVLNAFLDALPAALRVPAQDYMADGLARARAALADALSPPVKVRAEGGAPVAVIVD